MPCPDCNPENEKPESQSKFKKKLEELKKDQSFESVSKRGGFTTLDISKGMCLLGEALIEIDRLEARIKKLEEEKRERTAMNKPYNENLEYNHEDR